MKSFNNIISCFVTSWFSFPLPSFNVVDVSVDDVVVFPHNSTRQKQQMRIFTSIRVIRLFFFCYFIKIWDWWWSFWLITKGHVNLLNYLRHCFLIVFWIGQICCWSVTIASVGKINFFMNNCWLLWSHYNEILCYDGVTATNRKRKLKITMFFL